MPGCPIEKAQAGILMRIAESGDGAVQILYHRQLAQAENREEAERAFAEEYRKKFYNPYVVASIGLIDEVIEPQETRIKLVRALEVLRSKVQQNPSKKHGLVPL